MGVHEESPVLCLSVLFCESGCLTKNKAEALQVTMQICTL